MNATLEELEEVDNGPERAEALRRVVRRRRQPQSQSQSSVSSGCGFENGEEELPKEGPLTGWAYVVTGTLENFTREQARAALEERGAKVSDNVSSKQTGVIVRRGARQVEADEGGEGRRTAARPDGSRRASRASGLGPSRTGPGPFGPRSVETGQPSGHREHVAVADEAGKRRRVVGGFGLGATTPAAAVSRIRVGERPLGDRQRREQRRPNAGVVPHHGEQRAERAGRHPVEQREPEASTIRTPSSARRHERGVP